MRNFSDKFIFISAIILGIFSTIAGVCAFFLLYDDVMDLENRTVVIAVIVALVIWVMFFIVYGLVGLLKKRKVIEQLRIVAGAFFLLSLIAIPSALTYFMVEALGPRPLYMRQESINLDVSYEFETQYGDLNKTTYASILWGTPEPSEPAEYAWGESYFQRHLLHYYNVTNNASLFEMIIDRIDLVVENNDWNGDGVPGYGTDQYEGYYIEYPVWDGMICLPIIEAAHLIKDNSGLWAVYEDNYTIYLDMCERVIRKWNKTNWYEEEGPYGRYGYYRSPDDGGKKYNRIHSLGRVCCELYRITNNQTYKSMVEKIGRFFKMALELYSYEMDGQQHEMVIWPYSEYNSTPEWNQGFGASDTSHGAIDIDFADYCYKLGVVFDDRDMEMFANTFFDFVFKGFSADPIYADKVDGEVTDDQYFLNIRDGYGKMWRYYRDSDLALYMVERATEVMVEDGALYCVGTRMMLPYLLEVEENNIWD